eukprot:267817_1
MSELKDITKTILHQTHTKQLESGQNNKQNELQILAALGGIDDVLSTYLTNSDITLRSQTIKTIYQIIDPQQSTTIRSDPKANEEINSINKKPDVSISLDPSDNFLRSKFGESAALQIEEFLYNKYVILLIGFLNTVWMILDYLYFEDGNNIFYPVYTFVLAITCCIPFFVLCAMSMNRVTTKMIVKTFDFWAKIVYVILWKFSGFLYYFVLKGYQYKNIALWRITGITQMFSFTSFVLMLGLLDGLHSRKLLKNVFGSMASFYWLYVSLNAQFLSYSNNGQDDSILRLFGNVQISLLNMLSRSTRILFIFTVKQWIMMLYGEYRATHSTAASITIKPYFKWDHQISTQAVLATTMTTITSTVSDVDIVYIDDTANIQHTQTTVDNQNPVDTEL